jgi:hypothetical protein
MCIASFTLRSNCIEMLITSSDWFLSRQAQFPQMAFVFCSLACCLSSRAFQRPSPRPSQPPQQIRQTPLLGRWVSVSGTHAPGVSPLSFPSSTSSTERELTLLSSLHPEQIAPLLPTRPDHSLPPHLFHFTTRPPLRRSRRSGLAPPSQPRLAHPLHGRPFGLARPGVPTRGRRDKDGGAREHVWVDAWREDMPSPLFETEKQIRSHRLAFRLVFSVLAINIISVILSGFDRGWELLRWAHHGWQPVLRSSYGFLVEEGERGEEEGPSEAGMGRRTGSRG